MVIVLCTEASLSLSWQSSIPLKDVIQQDNLPEPVVVPHEEIRGGNCGSVSVHSSQSTPLVNEVSFNGDGDATFTKLH